MQCAWDIFILMPMLKSNSRLEKWASNIIADKMYPVVEFNIWVLEALSTEEE